MNISELTSAEVKSFVQDHLLEDPALLLLKYQGKVSFDLRETVQQIAARQKAAKKMPEWSGNPDILFPESISMEQSSSEETAKFKAKGLQGRVMADLTGGFGVDFFYLSKGFEVGIYCERQPELFRLSKHNLTMLSPGKLDFYQGSGLEYLKNAELKFDLIYVDPARRGSGNQKLYKLQDCEPDVVNAWSLLRGKAKKILIKVSPMLDISQAWAELPEIQKITIVSVKNEVKELLLFWEDHEDMGSKRIDAIDLGSSFPNFEFDPMEESAAVSRFGEPEKYLVEPLSGILKAGAFSLFGNRFGLKKLEKNSHLYTGNEIPEEIPGRVFEVVREISSKKQEIKALFPSGKVNVLCRNYCMGAEELKKKFGLKDGGEDFLIGTRTQSRFKVFWCRRIRSSVAI